MDISTALNRGLLFDGGMGTLLAERGLKPGQPPYILNLTAPETVLEAHRKYVAAGADVVSSNTFTAVRPEEVAAGVRLAAQAGAKFTALSLGPTGQLLEPMGEMTFEQAYEHYSPLVKAGAEAGADLILFETMSDLYECKAAVLAAKEQTNLPIFCTVTVQENGRTLTGCDLPTAAVILAGLGVSALGVNCSLGPAQLRSWVKELAACSPVPVIVQPNAGLPRADADGRTVYDVTPEVFAEYMEGFVRMGVKIAGGCCGTTPEHIKRMRDTLSFDDKNVRKVPGSNDIANHIIAASGTRAAVTGGGPLVIGERLNPTGKKRLRQALREGNMDVVISEAMRQQEAGCHILDVNAGLPGLDEPKVLAQAVRAVQSVSNLPVQIDSSDPAAIEAALRVVNGKAIVNSVSGKKESLDKILPLVRHYGAAVVGLTLDENGIPETAEARLAVAGKIRDAAAKHGIPDRDILIDCLTLTVASQPEQTQETLRAVRMVKEKMGLATVLGVSNVSYGMPEREKLGAAFLTAALASGLDAAIMNPLSAAFADAVETWRLLSGRAGSANGGATEGKPLQWYIEQYDAGKVFLPELLLAANREIETLQAQRALNAADAQASGAPPILLASVLGDIHDIGKNIVKTMLECHGFSVVDLGKDVPSGRVVAAVGQYGAKLVGLSALMTTTVRNMRDTVDAVKAAYPGCAVMIGGAAVDAAVSGAAFYGRDALAAVAIAKNVLGGP